MDSIISVFLTNLCKYNEGELIGEWVALPIDEDELATIRERIGINEEYEEEFLTDWESPIRALYEYIGEYTSIESLNELTEQLEDIPEDDSPILNAIYDITRDFDNMHYLDSTWFIQTNLSTKQVFEHLEPHIDKNDNLLVMEVKGNYYGRLPKDAWDYLSRMF